MKTAHEVKLFLEGRSDREVTAFILGALIELRETIEERDKETRCMRHLLESLSNGESIEKVAKRVRKYVHHLDSEIAASDDRTKLRKAIIEKSTIALAWAAILYIASIFGNHIVGLVKSITH